MDMCGDAVGQQRQFKNNRNGLIKIDKEKTERKTHKIQCPPLNGITLGRHRIDYNNRMIQLTDVFCVLLKYNWANNI